MTDMKDKQIEFLYIDNGTSVYIKKAGHGHDFPIKEYRFDGVQASTTNRREFVEIAAVPLIVEERVHPAKYVNPRWEVRGENSLGLPSVLPYSEVKAYSVVHDRNFSIPKEYVSVVDSYTFESDGCYYDFVEVESVFAELASIHGYTFISTTRRPRYSIEDEISTDPALLQEKPCLLSSEESYAIIRAHVKANIDHKVAAITSDYDFCFTVEKIIPLYESQSYQVDVNNQNFFQKRKRKSKWETRYRVDRKAVVYKAAPPNKRQGVRRLSRVPNFPG